MTRIWEIILRKSFIESQGSKMPYKIWNKTKSLWREGTKWTYRLESMKKDYQYELIAFSHKQRNQPLKKSGMRILYLNFNLFSMLFFRMACCWYLNHGSRLLNFQKKSVFHLFFNVHKSLILQGVLKVTIFIYNRFWIRLMLDQLHISFFGFLYPLYLGLLFALVIFWSIFYRHCIYF